MTQNLPRWLLVLGFSGFLVLGGCQEWLRRFRGQEPQPQPVFDVVPQVDPYQPAEAPIVNEPMPEPVVQVRTYIVKRNDTLWSIALRIYGDGKRWRDIVAANDGLDPTKMRIGQEIVLP